MSCASGYVFMRTVVVFLESGPLPLLEDSEMSDIKGPQWSSLDHAIYVLARKRTGILFQEASERFEALCEGEKYSGQACEFRWVKKRKICHRTEFGSLYGKNSEKEWRSAQKLMGSYESFIIPGLLLEEVENDL